MSVNVSERLELHTVPAVATQPIAAKWNKIKPADANSLTINKAKFSPLTSERTPLLSPVWRAALKGVVLKKEEIWDHPNRMLFKGFALPDPFMLTSHEINQARLERHLIIWLLLRPGWLMYTTSRSSVIPSVMPQTQHWKSYFVQLSRKLGFEKSISSAPSSSAASNTFASNDPSTQTARGRPEKKQKVQKARPGTLLWMS